MEGKNFMPQLPISVQLYTLRDYAAKDMPGLLKRLAAIGYRSVEVAGNGNLKSAKDLRKALDDAGLKVSGQHVGLDQLENDQALGRALDDTQTLGNSTIIVPWLPPERRTSAADWKQLAGSLSKIAPRVAAAGIGLAYHNHDFEFAAFDNRFALDILLESLTNPHVKIELDVYWVKFAGQDPIAWINKLGPRLTLLHLKDMAAGADRRFAPIGTGTMDFPAIVSAGARIGVQFGVVEQDQTYDLDPLKAVELSLVNLKKLGLAS